jgi:hypothetical protein
MEMDQFIGEWEDSDGKMSIKNNGQFMLKFGAQKIRGNGKFEEIDDSLYFIVEAKCQLEKYKEPNSRPQLISDYQYDPNNYENYDEICRIQIHIFQADNPDKFQLAAAVIISNLEETEGYYSSHVFGKVSP